ncbi:hypothetical protein IQ268_15255 [Oculatella sp. LEGE 06141]|uniref:hypothetical protein n=1 Tax=Oculatella sp. LEGE 06141 TaxID=1828648 RepID=UPI0018825168|nr:hypothetical protein [Oculatella sp. LEGE 06141]MBE9179928.1 hypothetical protein [Oculatella sp. LEGE 06141]
MNFPNSLPDPNFELDFKSREQTHFLQLNILKLAAFAWKEYRLRGKGAMTICGVPAVEENHLDRYEVELGYLTTEEVLHFYPRAIELIQFVTKYNPVSGLVITFTNDDGSLKDSYHLTLTMPLSQCYVLWQEKLLEQTVD